MRASATDNPVDTPTPQTGVAGSLPVPACAEELLLAPDADEVALELHECIVWSSGISFSHQLPDAFISTAAVC